MKFFTLRDILPLHCFTKVKQPSARYLKGIASYGIPVKSEKRKLRILAELNAMGVKPRVRIKMRRKVVRTSASYNDYVHLPWNVLFPRRYF